MPEKTIIEQIHDIMDTLRSELLSAGAINGNDDIIKPQMFIDIIEHKESELGKFDKEVEDEAGVVKDRTAFNILENYYWNLGRMKEQMSLHPEDRDPEDPTQIDPEAEMMKPTKPSAFKTGIRKLLGKLKGRFIPSNSNSNNR
ncbi:MAG: hypothetical protein IKZ49_03390 [Alphaproteobacteria bacterium]|nr:hypothetical protein [Alphaproteobacteria bacterium]